MSMFVKSNHRLVHDALRKAFLIIDGYPFLKAKIVRDCEMAASELLKLFFLPPYTPEGNPDGLVRNELRNYAIGRNSIQEPD